MGPAGRPLEGLRVLDLTQVVSGAVATMLMADFGAEVLKIEPPTGEAYRNSGFTLENEGESTNLNILRWSRGKKSVALDLKSEEGRSILRRLVATADVLVENFRPGVLERLGLDIATLKESRPDLIYVTVSGFGHDDLFPAPYRDRPAYAIISEAMAGLTNLAGDRAGPPVWMGFAMADIFAGTLAFAGSLLALLDRAGHPNGRRVDISMYDGSLFMNDLALILQTAVGETLGGGQYLLQSPWGPFRARDGHFVIAVLVERQWHALCAVIERPDLAADENLAAGRDRSRLHDELVKPAISAWCGTRGKEECAELLLAGGVPAAPVNTTRDLLDCPQLLARQMLVDVEAPVIGQARVVGNPIKLDGPAVDGAATAIPRLGEHTRAVLRTVLEIDETELDELQRVGAIVV
jgi:crotonobetainyl-CoA:carnitine CoA-transferase CaiB-like acyl-CoA transferase